MLHDQSHNPTIEGHLDLFIAHHEEEFEGVVSKWEEIMLHGDPQGLRSLAQLLLKIADLNQEDIADTILPEGAREHLQLQPGTALSKSSVKVIVGRLDAKGSGAFYPRFIPKETK